MKAVIERVLQASVDTEGEISRAIGPGLLVLIGIEREDVEADADYLAKKTARIRIFNDDDGKMNLSLDQTGGEVLAISQFTLAADTKKGNRPSFTRAASPDEGLRLYDYFVEALRGHGVSVKTGFFRTHMHVALVNDGPVTIIIDSSQRFARGRL